MGKPVKNVSIMCFHDELCQVFNAMMTALSLLRQGAKVTVFFGSRGVNALHRDKVAALTCLPDMPEVGAAVMKRMDEMDLPLVEDLFFMFIAEGGEVLACPLNVPLFGMSERDLIDGAKLADPARYYQNVVIPADMNLTF
ncbi:MAG: hypothetical protein COS39_11190 [Hydrogenophilales bacterium CG03_land_8_20_14_0_80_62_28]|nr:hypothetical protein [Betaproteobacteria bacterium]OIO77275.1 MAG: hypothetical protein AUJ86_09125 [Hydrogenophilaceae bacterium CG1_02_62_390]PIV21400.1 MAG: hypothetical protein COS39_11190 [Hydrogenophilales bacterium CG03_land_8_20_14_0_80_62_28]PIW38246.1 MAG: hypothetical protein COW23_07565 [Hydrogenophilales bacterium CG15_BIG_FIL_POST_REV_8_21_14_020_62_31]PIW71845.1 MAG: hypothetical protein COW07_06115 [Hydrogenophilales bacterium CG12_big_fil_rev_8_21_14_0_65_61_21]PIX01875.1 M